MHTHACHPYPLSQQALAAARLATLQQLQLQCSLSVIKKLVLESTQKLFILRNSADGIGSLFMTHLRVNAYTWYVSELNQAFHQKMRPRCGEIFRMSF